MTSCTDTFAQYVASDVFGPPAHSKSTRRGMRATRERARDARRSRSTVVVPEGAFYVCVRLPDGTSSLRPPAISRFDVVAIPGVAFGEAMEGWLRLSWVPAIGAFAKVPRASPNITGALSLVANLPFAGVVLGLRAILRFVNRRSDLLRWSSSGRPGSRVALFGVGSRAMTALVNESLTSFPAAPSRRLLCRMDLYSWSDAHCTEASARVLLFQTDPNRLNVDELVNPECGEFASVAAAFDAAERQPRIAGNHAVDENAARFDAAAMCSAGSRRRASKDWRPSPNSGLVG